MRGLTRRYSQPFCLIQSHTGQIVHFVEETRTAVDWAEKILYLVDVIAAEAEKITLVMNDLNTHKIVSLYNGISTGRTQADCQET